MDYFNNCMEYIQDIAQNCQDIIDCVKQDIFIDKIQRMAEDILEHEEDKNLETH